MSTDKNTLATLFETVRTIAVVGLSNKPHRASYGVAQYMQAQGYSIVGVNPTMAGKDILGVPCYASLQQAAQELAKEHIRIDVVDCFRKADDIAPLADGAIEIGAPYLWLQLGIDNPIAAGKARAAGLTVIVDRCIKIDHARWLAEKPGAA